MLIKSLHIIVINWVHSIQSSSLFVHCTILMLGFTVVLVGACELILPAVARWIDTNTIVPQRLWPDADNVWHQQEIFSALLSQLGAFGWGRSPILQATRNVSFSLVVFFIVAFVSLARFVCSIEEIGCNRGRRWSVAIIPVEQQNTLVRGSYGCPRDNFYCYYYCYMAVDTRWVIH